MCSQAGVLFIMALKNQKGLNVSPPYILQKFPFFSCNNVLNKFVVPYFVNSNCRRRIEEYMEMAILSGPFHRVPFCFAKWLVFRMLAYCLWVPWQILYPAVHKEGLGPVVYAAVIMQIQDCFMPIKSRPCLLLL
jgi:hypothetical protein